MIPGFHILLMNLRKALTKDSIKLDLESTSKSGVIEELLDLLVASGKINDRKTALKALLEREKKMSTGMQKGIAIPHAKTDMVDSIVAAIGVKKEGVNFGALDGQPSNIFILTLSPAKRAGPHIQFLAEVSRMLNNDEVRNRVLQANSRNEIIEMLASSNGS